jgi:hypothetical protein
MPDIIQTIRDTYAENPAAALNMLPELFKQYDGGLIKAFPCKPGEIWHEKSDPIREIKVVDIITNRLCTAVRYREKGSQEIFAVNPIYFSLHFFKTRAEAEKALKEHEQEA